MTTWIGFINAWIGFITTWIGQGYDNDEIVENAAEQDGKHCSVADFRPSDFGGDLSKNTATKPSRPSRGGVERLNSRAIVTDFPCWIVFVPCLRGGL